MGDEPRGTNSEAWMGRRLPRSRPLRTPGGMVGLVGAALGGAAGVWTAVGHLLVGIVIAFAVAAAWTLWQRTAKRR